MAISVPSLLLVVVVVVALAAGLRLPEGSESNQLIDRGVDGNLPHTDAALHDMMVFDDGDELFEDLVREAGSELLADSIDGKQAEVEDAANTRALGGEVAARGGWGCRKRCRKRCGSKGKRGICLATKCICV